MNVSSWVTLINFQNIDWKLERPTPAPGNKLIQLLADNKKVKVKSSMAKSLPVENLLPQNVGSIINYVQ